MAKSEVMGIGELKQNFGRLKDGMQTRIGRAMVVSAGGVLKKKAKAGIQAQGLVRSGSMLKNVVIKREASAPAGTVQYHLGVRHGRDKTRKQRATVKLAVGVTGRVVKRYEDDPYYWRFHEFGTKKQAAQPFLGPALEEGAGEAIDAMSERLQKELDKAGSA